MAEHPITLQLRFRPRQAALYMRCVQPDRPRPVESDDCPFCGLPTHGEGDPVVHTARFLDLQGYPDPSYYDGLAHPACLVRAEVIQQDALGGARVPR